MDETDLLRRELRAAREELIRKSRTAEGDPVDDSRLPLMPDRDEEFLRLALMTADELETHVERLERDLEDLRRGIEAFDE